MIQEKIITGARHCLGTPFHHQGRACNIGLDCIGVAVHALKVAGISVRDETDYGRKPEGERLITALTAHGFEEVDEVQGGDILLFRFNNQPQHVGVAVSDNTMIHSYAPIGRVVETGLSEIWQRRLAAIYRLKNI